MARVAVLLCLALFAPAVFTDSAAASGIHHGLKGKAMLVGKGKAMAYAGKGVSYQTVQKCDQKCMKKCEYVPKDVCTDVEVPYQECQKVPVKSTETQCADICEPVVVQPTYTKGKAMMVPMGKKGRKLQHLKPHLLGKGKGKQSMAVAAAYGKGKGYMSAKCQKVCKEVEVVSVDVQCVTKTKTLQECHKEVEAVCGQVCKPFCIDVVVPVKVEAEPVMVASGKGKAMAIPMLNKKGH